MSDDVRDPVSTTIRPGISRETPEEVFRELVQRAMREQGIDSSEMAEYYLVALLQRAIGGGFSPKNLPIPSNWPPPQTLAEAMLLARNLAPAQRDEILKWIGDRALFVSGYFAESLERKCFSPGYYQDMGRLAYSDAAQSQSRRSFAEMFRDLSARFSEYVRVIGGVRSFSQRSEGAGLLITSRALHS